MSNRYDEFDPAAYAAASLAAAEAHIACQHVVSRVVLKNFEGAVRGSRKIGVYHVRFGATRPIGRNKAGLAQDLLRVGSTSAEALWARTENRIDSAVKAVRELGADAPPLSLHVLRKATALHFARSKETVELLDGLWEKRGSHLVSAIVERNRSLLTAHFTARNNRRPTEGDLHELVRESTQDGTHVNTTGAWTRARVEQVFADLNSPERIPRRMVVIRPVRDSEFVIADNPVTTHIRASGEAPRTPTRIGWDAADEIVMPFAPDLAVCLVRDAGSPAALAMCVADETASAERVAQLNGRQVRSARHYLFHRPGHAVASQVTAILDTLNRERAADRV